MKFRIFAVNLFAHEILHISVAVLISLFIFWEYKQIDLSLIAFFTSIFVDVDHFLEGLIIKGLDLRWLAVSSNYWRQSGKMTIIFHSWELLPIILIIGKAVNQWQLACTVVIAVVGHYLVDQLVYMHYGKMSAYQYFFIYRAMNNFDFKKLDGRK